MNKLAFVVATKDRLQELRRLMESLLVQTCYPAQVIVVDSSGVPVEVIEAEFPMLTMTYLRHPLPSASAQRNAGIRAVDSDIDLVGFLDDDVVLESNALENLLRFWESAPEEVGGCALNLMDNSSPISGLKGSTLIRWLGLYSNRKYSVMPSGWQTRAGTVKETTFVQWLPTTASVWRKEVFDSYSFDEFFDGYSYLEDFDFSYAVSRRYKLAVLSNAKFWHFPSKSGRESVYRFGKTEVRNRLYIVRKHNLSLWRCYAVLMTRLGMTLFRAVGQPHMARRFMGNCVGLAQALFMQRRDG